MRQRAVRVIVLLLGMAAMGALAHAQGGATSTIAGVVVDNGGGVVPGADVVVKHKATGVTTANVTNSEGAFSFPGLNIGTYTVTVSLQGFKTVVFDNVVLTSGAPASVRAVLEVGGITEQVVVSSASEIVQTQSSTISSTINANQIVKLPLTTRSAMDFVPLLPGVATPGGNRQSQINGLPRGAINITLDGVNVQDNTLRTGDGFFAIVAPRLDAVEEVSVTTAAQGADGSGQGAVQIKFVTRSGTNAFTGSGFHFYRSDKLNANTWFNNRDIVAKPKLKQNQGGARIGGPLTIPGLFDGRNKAFFFANYEEFRQPSDLTRNRTVLNTAAQAGDFTYQTAGGTNTVNVLALAAQNGHLSTVDPVIGTLLADIRAAVSGGSLSELDPNLQRFSFNVPISSLRRFPTGRVDYNLTEKHRFGSAYNGQFFTDFPDTLNNRDATFPGFPVAAGQSSERHAWSNSLRSTLSTAIVNEARVGYSGAPVQFFKELNTGLFGGTAVANQGGFHLNFPAVGSALTGAGALPIPQSRNASSLLVEDTVTWLKGSHSLAMGASWSQFSLWAKNSGLVPQLNFGVVTGDPAQGLFTQANFPGASGANLTAAQNLYALLTGRVSQINGDARLDEKTNEYVFMGTGTQRARMREAGFFIQDAWRLKPNVTLNAGIRYELQFPFSPLNDSYSTATMEDLCGISGMNAEGKCNLFQPGVMTGKRPEFVNFGRGTRAYNVDYDNIAPSIGLAWTVSGAPGFLGRLTGRDGDTVLRAGYSRAYNRNGLNDFSGQYAGNPGVVITTPRRNINDGNLNDGLGLPVLFRETARLGPAPFPAVPTYPLTDIVSEDINIFDPNIQVPYADSWSAGIQRQVSANMAIEVRYVGTRSRQNWATPNFNEINIFDNDFIGEFRQAQANLQANVAAGLASQGFKYLGPGTGTAPLPTIFAHFQGSGDPNNPASYTSANFTSNTFLTPLAMFNPNPFGFAANLFGDAGRRANAANAGIPANFFVMNPDLLGGADLTTNLGETDFHSLQLELRRRLAHGLQFQASYVFGKNYLSQFRTFRREQLKLRDAGNPGEVTQAFKANVVYELPFGQGRRFGSGANGLVDRIIGGWSIGLVAKMQSGWLIDLGNVRLVGMSPDEVGKLFKVRVDDSGKKVYMWPQSIIDETIKAFSVSATSPTGYGTLGPPSGKYFAPANGPDCIEVDNGAQHGDCTGRRLFVHGPMFNEHDISVSKRVKLAGQANIEFRFEMLNAFNNHNFLPVNGIGNNPANYEVTALTGVNTSRVIQLVSRINW